MTKVYLPLYGGLGNQLFQCSAALSLEKEFPVSVLTNWGFARKSVGGNLDVQQFDWGQQLRFLNTPITGSLGKRFLNLLLRLGAEEKRILLAICKFLLTPYFSFMLRVPIVIKVNQGLGFSKMITSRNVLLIGYFQSFRYFENSNRELMSIRPKVICNEARGVLEEIKDTKVLIVHVRRGDYQNEKFGLLGDSYYHDALAISEAISYDEVWVFSDEISRAREIYSLNSLSNVRFVEDTNFTNAETLEIMRHGSGFIIANSSFSWWAAQLRHDRDAPVFCPSPWFKYTESPKELIEEGWVKVNW